MAALLNIEALGQRRESPEFTGELFTAFQNDFSAVVVFLHFSTDLNDLARKLSHVPNVFQIMREDHDAKAAKPIVVAKIKIVGSSRSRLHAHHFPGNALRFANMLVCLIKGNAGGKG